MLKRKTPLKTKTPLKQKTQLKAKTSLKIKSELKNNSTLQAKKRLKKNSYSSRFEKKQKSTGIILTKKCKIISKENILAIKKRCCELCNNYANELPHHIRTTGSGGDDIKENLIQLCFKCHIKAHSGEIKKESLFTIVAKRENLPLETVLELVYKNRKMG